MKVSYLVLSAAILAISACRNVTAPFFRRLAVIDSQLAGRIDAPDTVRVNVAFNATVYAVESSSLYCNQPAGQTLTMEGSVARITIYVQHLNVRELTCPADIKLYPYAVSVRFPIVGVGTVRVVGSKYPWARPESLDSISRAVVVVP